MTGEVTMDNLIKMIIKNFISIILSILLTLISFFVIFRISVLVLDKILPCDMLRRGDVVVTPMPPSPPLPLGCQIALKDATIPTLVGLIVLLIIWYLLLRKLLGKFIK